MFGFVDSPPALEHFASAFTRATREVVTKSALDQILLFKPSRTGASGNGLIMASLPLLH
jgi:hypothetical protein